MAAKQNLVSATLSEAMPCLAALRVSRASVSLFSNFPRWLLNSMFHFSVNVVNVPAIELLLLNTVLPTVLHGGHRIDGCTYIYIVYMPQNF